MIWNVAAGILIAFVPLILLYMGIFLMGMQGRPEETEPLFFRGIFTTIVGLVGAALIIAKAFGFF